MSAANNEEVHHLYGRLDEVEQLRNSYSQVVSTPEDGPHLVLLLGPVGIGKRALAETLRPAVHSDSGLFLSGRCLPIDHGNDGSLCQQQNQHVADRPCSAYSEIIEDLIISMNNENRKTLRDTFLLNSQLFSNSEQDLLRRTLPFVDRWLRVDSPQSSKTSATIPAYLRGVESQEEPYYVMTRLIRAATTLFPVILHFDHGHYANAKALRFLELLLQVDTNFQSSSKGLLIVVSIRDDALLSEPVDSFIRQVIEKRGTSNQNDNVENTSEASLFDWNRIHIIHLSNISRDVVHQWTTNQFRSLSLAEDIKQYLFEVIYGRTLGNPRFIQYLLRYLESSNSFLSLDDAALNGLQAQIPERVEDLYVLLIQQQDEVVQRVVETAAAIENCGGVVEYRLLEFILERPCREPLLTSQSFGLLQIMKGKIRFPSPELRDAAYSLITESNRASFHLNIGRIIWKNYLLIADYETNENAASMLNVMSQQLRRGVSDVTDDEELCGIATISLKAGKRAMQASDFFSAETHFDSGIAMLGDDPWKTDCYNVCIELHNCAAEAHYCTRNFDRMEHTLDAIFQHAITFQDKLQAYTVLVYTNGARHRLPEAVQTALIVLKELGEPMPSNPSKLVLLIDLIKTRWVLRGKTDRFFLNLPAATNTDKVAAIQMLNFICIYTYISKPQQGGLALMRILRLSIRFGITGPFVTALSAYGFLLAGRMNRIEEGFRYGQLSLALLDQCEASAWLPRIYFYVYGLTNRWKIPLRECLEPLRQAIQSALNTGDIEGSVLTASTYVVSLFHVGMQLESAEQEARSYCQLMHSMGQTLGLLFLVPRWNLLSELAGDGNAIAPLMLSGDVTDPTTAFNVAKRVGNNLAVFMYRCNRTMLYCLRGDYVGSLAVGKEAREAGYHSDFGLCFYEGMAALAVAKTSSPNQRRLCIKIGKSAAKRFKDWARICPANFENKHALLEAELAVLQGKWDKGMSLFDASIKSAQKEGFCHEEGLAYERLAQLHISRGHTPAAIPCFEAARDAYQRWGAQTLVRGVEEKLGHCRQVKSDAT